MTRILEQRLQINAPARIVYALLTEAAGLLEWMGSRPRLNNAQAAASGGGTPTETPARASSWS
ncbi:MAG: hypothetical protein AB7K36_04905 [Chloroflexota bacterium]